MNETLLTVWVDADACHVRAEVVCVCRRYGVAPRFVANKAAPPANRRRDAEYITVSGDLDAADDYIAERLAPGDLVLTGDIPFAARAIAAGGHALDFRGRWFTEENIGDFLARRRLNRYLRDSGVISGGPASPAKAERALFLQELNNFLDRAVRGTA